jgi:hypothetical protein
VEYAAAAIPPELQPSFALEVDEGDDPRHNHERQGHGIAEQLPRVPACARSSSRSSILVVAQAHHAAESHHVSSEDASNLITRAQGGGMPSCIAKAVGPRNNGKDGRYPHTEEQQ